MLHLKISFVRVLVIFGRASKGVFAYQIAQYILEKNKYDTFIGTSNASLRIPYLALNKTEKIKEIFISLNQRSMFNKRPFVVKYVSGKFDMSISHIIFIEYQLISFLCGVW